MDAGCGSGGRRKRQTANHPGCSQGGIREENLSSSRSGGLKARAPSSAGPSAACLLIGVFPLDKSTTHCRPVRATPAYGHRPAAIQMKKTGEVSPASSLEFGFDRVFSLEILRCSEQDLLRVNQPPFPALIITEHQPLRVELLFHPLMNVVIVF